MRLIEIFYSIQGEGPAMGSPATFVRLAGCNLRCQGCDTDNRLWQELSPKEVIESIRSRMVVITGGEPTMQMEELSQLVSLLQSQDSEIHIETNGTNTIAEAILEKFHYVVVSPKRGSDYHLDFWAEKKNVHFKFVLGKASWCWTPELLREIAPTLERERTWIMAYGTDPSMPEAKDAWDLALSLGVNYSDRLHIRLKRK